MKILVEILELKSLDGRVRVLGDNIIIVYILNEV
jgi:hypothetical protein